MTCFRANTGFQAARSYRRYRVCPYARRLHTGRFSCAAVTQRRYQRFARPVHYAADDRDVHRGIDIFQTLLQRVHRADNVELWREQVGQAVIDAARANAQRLQGENRL